MKTHYSIAELLELQLAILPSTRKGLDKYLTRNLWKYREVPSRGKGGTRREYELSDEVQALVCVKELQQVVKVQATTAVELTTENQVSSVIAKPVLHTDALDLTNTQREVAENRLFLVRWVQEQVIQGFKKTDVIMHIVEGSRRGDLIPPELLEAVCKANAKGAGKCVVSRRSLFDWIKDVEDASQHGINVIALLAPKVRDSKDSPAWAIPLLNLYRTPQKPTLAACLEILPEHYSGNDVPSYHTAYRYLNEKMGKVDLQKGRMGKRELKNIQPFIRRDTSKLLPADVYTADGHCFDAEVAHPMHGKPFRPEITAILDVATRRIVGWSVSLAESSWCVLDAIRMCAVECGIPAIFYVDNGSGYKNDLLSAQGRGVMNRLGVTMRHALPYNSQAKGMIERSHQTLWVKAAKKLPTYIGKPMDSEASQYAFKTTRREISEIGRSHLLMAWSDFLAFAKNVVDDYNHKPHKGLKRIVDTETGKSRYQSPLEAWNEALHLGSPIECVEDWDAEDLFRPYEERKVLRGEISLFNNKYFSMELEQFHGEMVLVGYDIHNAQQITVRTLEGRFICYAVWNANKRDYFPVPKVQQARELRAAGRNRRLAAKQQEVREELSPAAMLEHMESQTVISFPQRDRAEIFAELEAIEPRKEIEAFNPKYRIMDVAGDVCQRDEGLSRWMALDVKVLGGVVLTNEDQDFWKWFQLSKRFKRLSIDDDALRHHLEQTEQQREALGF